MKTTTQKQEMIFSKEIITTGRDYIISLNNYNLAKKDLNSKLETIITVYLDNCLKYVKENKDTLTNGLPLNYNAKVSKFKLELIKALNQDVDNNISIPAKTAFDVFNKVMKKANEKLLTKLRLMDYSTIKKFSELEPKYLKYDALTNIGLNYDDDYKKIVEYIKASYKEQQQVKQIETKKSSLEKIGFNVSKSKTKKLVEAK